MNKIIIFAALACMVSLAHAGGYLYQPPVPAVPAPVPAAGVLAPTVLRTNPPLVISNAAPLPYYAAAPYGFGPASYGYGAGVIPAAAPLLSSSPYAVYGK